MPPDLRATRHDLEALVRDLDVDAIPVCEAPDQWKEYIAIARLGTAAATLLARRVEEGETWRKGGFKSAADQLALLSGTSVNTAKDQLKTSKRVKKLPKTAHAMRNAKLSPEKAAAIADAADVEPDAEDKLLEGAEKKPLAELREDCLKAKAKDRDRAHKRIHRDRCAFEFKDGEGAWKFGARGTLDSACDFRSEWKRLTDEQFKLAKAEGREEPMAAYAYDALMELARRSARADHTPETELTATEPATKKRARAKRAPAKYLTILRLDYETLVRGSVEGEECCEIAGLGPIPVRIARELLDNAILKLVITKGVDVMNVTHLGRSVNMAQRIALLWQSPMCTREDCTRTERLENDHRVEWHKSHHTRLDESDRLCGHDHRLKTNHGWALVRGKGRRAMVPPGDPRHPNYRPPQRQ